MEPLKDQEREEEVLLRWGAAVTDMEIHIFEDALDQAFLVFLESPVCQFGRCPHSSGDWMGTDRNPETTSEGDLGIQRQSSKVVRRTHFSSLRTSRAGDLSPLRENDGSTGSRGCSEGSLGQNGDR